MRKRGICDDLVNELESNLIDIDKMHNAALHIDSTIPDLCDMHTDSNGNRTHGLLRKRDPCSRTIADIIEDSDSGVPMTPAAKRKLGPNREVIQTSSRLARRSPQTAPKIWSAEERKLLYDGLRMFGTDFSMISTFVLKNRSRTECYKRFQREDRLKPELITKALQWNSDHRLKLASRFSLALKAMNVDLATFDPLNPPEVSSRDDGIKPLEFYLLDSIF